MADSDYVPDEISLMQFAKLLAALVGADYVTVHADGITLGFISHEMISEKDISMRLAYYTQENGGSQE